MPKETYPKALCEEKSVEKLNTILFSLQGF